MTLLRSIAPYRRRAMKILDAGWNEQPGDFSPMVKALLGKRAALLELAKTNPTPFYALDEAALEGAITDFRTAFEHHVPGVEVYYAMKVNNYPGIVSRVVRAGLGVDVSSSTELHTALRARAKKILFTGPGKSRSDLELAVANRDRVIVNLDSFAELERLSAVAVQARVSVKAGVRIYGREHGRWSKFGIPLRDLKPFWTKARRLPGVDLQGIQFHCSWNRDGAPYAAMMRELASYLADEFSARMRSEVRFVDFGGGFRPYQSEGYYPWKVPAGQIAAIASSDARQDFCHRAYMIDSVTIEAYATTIGAEIREHLTPLIDASYFTEPGRIIANNAMHIVLSVVDVKGPRYAILDGGINLVGWERFEHDYFPLLNLTHPSGTRELDFELYGPLCMPQDTWGFSVFGTKVQLGDRIMVPCQGALTYSLAQSFIKPIAKVVVLPGAD